MPKGILIKKLSQKSRSSRTILILSMLWQCRICLTHTIIYYMWSKKLFLSFLKDLIFESRLNQYAAWAILWFSFASGKKRKSWKLESSGNDKDKWNFIWKRLTPDNCSHKTWRIEVGTKRSALTLESRPKLTKWVRNGSNESKMAKMSIKWPKCVQNCQNLKTADL